MNELALYAGAGGGLLGSRLLGWRTVCAVEKEPYCREVLLRRQRDGVLDLFPIWDDIKTFDGRPWRGVVDIVTAGFPCQPFSVSGRRKGKDDDRNLWPDTIRVIREVEPAFVLLENVPGLLSIKPDRTCVCRRVDRWRRLYRDTKVASYVRNVLQHSNRCRHGEQGEAAADISGKKTWGQGNPSAQEDPQMGRHIKLAYFWGRCGEVVDGDMPTASAKTQPGNRCSSTHGTCAQSPTTTKRQCSVVRRHEGTSGKAQDRNASTEQKGPTTNRMAGERVCRTCGGRVGNETTDPSGYAGTVFGDLAAGGYDCRWDCISAASIGAPHIRDRLWVVGKSVCRRRHGRKDEQGEGETRRNRAEKTSADVADAEEYRRDPRRKSDAAEKSGRRKPNRGSSHDGGTRWPSEPDVGRVADGVAFALDFA